MSVLDESSVEDIRNQYLIDFVLRFKIDYESAPVRGGGKSIVESESRRHLESSFEDGMIVDCRGIGAEVCKVIPIERFVHELPVFLDSRSTPAVDFVHLNVCEHSC